MQHVFRVLLDEEFLLLVLQIKMETFLQRPKRSEIFALACLVAQPQVFGPFGSLLLIQKH